MTGPETGGLGGAPARAIAADPGCVTGLRRAALGCAAIAIGLGGIAIAATVTARAGVAPVAWVSLGLLGLALILRTLRPGTASPVATQGLALGVALAAAVSLFAHAYGAHAPHARGPFESMPASAAGALLAAAVAILFARPEDGLMRYVVSAAPSGVMARRTLPLAILLPAATGWVRLEGQRAGHYDTELGLALFVSATLACFVGLTWWTAAALHRAQEERQLAETANVRSIAQGAARLRILADSSRQFVESPDLPTLLDLVARRLSEELGELCAIRLLAPDPAWFLPDSVVYHPDPELLALAQQHRVATPSTEGISGQVIARGEPLLLTGLEDKDVAAGTHARYRAMIERLRISSLIAVPLRGRRRVLGVVSMTRSDPSRPFTPEDLTLTQDLADRAALAMENLTLLAELEARVAQRTRALEEANAELEAFSSSVAHDLRAPLRGISGFSTALLEDVGATLDAQATGHLGRIVGAARRMDEIIDALLALARVSRTAPRREPVDLSRIAREVVAELAAASPARVVDAVIADDLTAQGDPVLVRQLLVNLLANAWKFTGRRASARIELGREEADGEVVFFVRDDGAGFDMALSDRLFMPFRRLHRATEFEGTGLGLATVQRIVRRHGGRIWAEGAVGQGATFRFTLAEGPPAAGRRLLPSKA